MHASRSGHNLLNKAIAIGIAMALFFSSTSILAWAADESKTLFTGSGRGGGSRPGHTNLKSGNIAAITAGEIISHFGARPETNLLDLINKKLIEK